MNTQYISVFPGWRYSGLTVTGCGHVSPDGDGESACLGPCYIYDYIPKYAMLGSVRNAVYTESSLLRVFQIAEQ